MNLTFQVAAASSALERIHRTYTRCAHGPAWPPGAAASSFFSPPLWCVSHDNQDKHVPIKEGACESLNVLARVKTEGCLGGEGPLSTQSQGQVNHEISKEFI